MKTNVHQNSITAFHAGAVHLSRRAKNILGVFRDIEEPMTDRDVAELMGFSDMNSVRPRITELCDAGLIEEVGSAKCKVTGKTVRKCKIEDHIIPLFDSGLIYDTPRRVQ